MHRTQKAMNSEWSFTPAGIVANGGYVYAKVHTNMNRSPSETTTFPSDRHLFPCFGEWQGAYFSQRSSCIIEIVPAQWTATRVAALEPPEKAAGVKCLLTRSTSLVGRLHVSRNDRITDSTFRLPLQRALHILTEGHQAIYQAPI